MGNICSVDVLTLYIMSPFTRDNQRINSQFIFHRHREQELKTLRNTRVQPLFVWFVLLNLFFDVVFSISFKHFLLSSHIRICRATYFYFQLILWDSYYSIFSFLVQRFVVHCLSVIFFVPCFTGSEYHFSIFYLTGKYVIIIVERSHGLS